MIVHFTNSAILSAYQFFGVRNVHIQRSLLAGVAGFEQQLGYLGHPAGGSDFLKMSQT
jgi:hypothetical protein